MSNTPTHEKHTMQCMEVWGGNQAVSSSVNLAGLDVHVYSRPYLDEDGGGDVYYVSSCATGRITRLLVADVSGHGAKVAEQARQLRDLMRQHVNHYDQIKFVQRMNSQFSESAALGSFATAIVTTYIAPTATLTLCNAGHPPPLIWRAKQKLWEYLHRGAYDGIGDEAGASDIPLGVADMADYQQLDVDLSPGDRVLCYTDSLPEARLPDGELIGPDVLLNIAQSVDGSDGPTVAERMLAAIEKHTGHAIDGDDITTLLIAPNDATRRIKIRARLFAPARLLGGMLTAIGRGGFRRLPLPDWNRANIIGAFWPWAERR